MKVLDIVVCSEEEMEQLGTAIAQVLEAGDLVYLIGDLGVGKTTLARGIARGLGYKGRVNSPTFVIMNIYENIPPIYHFDFYRLKTDDMLDLGLEDYLDKEGVILVEWPQAGEKILPREALVISISLIGGDYDRERTVNVSARGKRYRQKLEELKCGADISD